MRKTLAAVLAVAAGAAGFAARGAQPPAAAGPPPAAEAAAVRHLAQGWTDAERVRFYTTPQGSLLVPYDWFLNLEQVGNQKLFRADDHLDGFRYLPGRADPKHNPDGLPVGFTKEPTARHRADKLEAKLLRAYFRPWGAEEADYPAADAWLGLTCAACHTGQVEVGGKRLRVDGAPALADIHRFTQALSRAFEATLGEGAKFDRFAGRVLGKRAAAADKAALRRRVGEYSAALAAYRDRGTPQFPHGFGRTDALGSIQNEVLGTALGIPANYRPVDAPVSYPDLWLTPKLDWVQWNGSVANPFGRNVGEVLGVFGHVDAGALTKDGFLSTVRGASLHQLEQLIDKLRPPTWDEAVLGKLDPEKVARGAEVFEAADCAKCHGNKPPYPMTEPNQAKRQFIRTTMVPLKVIGTDPKTATNFYEREAYPGVLGQPNDPRVKAGGLLRQVVHQVTAQQFRELKLTPAQQQEYLGFRLTGEPPNLLAYKAKPLAGVWATAPYLHNGSVPNLHELLQPPAQRVRTFTVGSREYDPRAVGFRSDRSAGGFVFDTALPGNSNAGHHWGTERTDEEKADLIEYLKTL